MVATTKKTQRLAQEAAAAAAEEVAAAIDEGRLRYDRMKSAAAERNRLAARAGREVGPIMEVEDPKRRAAGAKSLKKFCETYLPQHFYLGWSPDHLAVIKDLERTIRVGGSFALAMPRGSGKTTLTVAAALWALVCGFRKFVFLIGANANAAESLMMAIKAELEHNELLLADFPEVCQPIQALEGINNRAKGQLVDGKPTAIVFTKNQLVLPTVAGSQASGSVIRFAGITGAIRGARHVPAEGPPIRPDLALVDDPQDDESARSLKQCADRERTLTGSILGLAGPDKKIALCMPCTVIRRGDLADRCLNRKIRPEFNGRRTKLIYEFPTNQELWDKYAELRREGLEEGDEGARATAFYRKNRKAMDAGAKPAWVKRFRPDEISAVQCAMNLKIDDEAAFWAEYQNEPLDEDVRPAGLLTADQIASKTNGLKRGVVALGTTHLTAFIDVHDALLYWMVLGSDGRYTSQVVDYRAWPDPGVPYFALHGVDRTLRTMMPGASRSVAILAALTDLVNWLCTHKWKREDGAELKVERLAIDANWGDQTENVKQFCKATPHSAIVIPSHGRGVGASKRPLNDPPRKPGERRGLHWQIPPMARGQICRHLLYDTNFYKSLAHQLLGVPLGDVGCLTLFGNHPREHRLLADHLTAEDPTEVSARGRVVDEWNQKVAKPDNHWLDCLVGCLVLAGMLGSSVTGADPSQKPQHSQKMKLSEMRRAKR